MKRHAVFRPDAQHADVDSKIVAAIDRISGALRALLRAQAQDESVSPIQAQILVLLLGRKDPERVGELAAAFEVTPATVSDALRTLEGKGLIGRERDPDDGRVSRMVLTQEGRRTAARLRSWADPVRDLLRGQEEGHKEVALGILLQLIADMDSGGQLARARVCHTCAFFRPEAHPDPSQPHHCTLLDRPLGLADLRVDCDEHEPVGR